jgi:hypothetical protein
MYAFCIGYRFQSETIPESDRFTPIGAMRAYAENVRQAAQFLDAQGALYHYEVVVREQWNWNNNFRMRRAAGIGTLAVIQVHSDDIALLMRLNYGVLPLDPNWRAWFESGADVNELLPLNFIESET